MSLIFVIDTTGSMDDEIAAAKEIAKAIATHPRNLPVDFILSPFNDPSKLSCFIHQRPILRYIINELTPVFHGVCPVIDNEFRHNIVKVAVDPQHTLSNSPLSIARYRIA